MSVVPDRWKEFFVIRLVVAALSLLGLAFRKKISVEMVAFIPVLAISFQNAYMYGVMDAEAFQKHTFAYLALYSPLSVEEIMVNGGLLTFTVAIFFILLIQTRFNLTKKEIVARLALAESNQVLEEQKEILEKTLMEWIGTGEQIDDILVIGIRV